MSPFSRKKVYGGETEKVSPYSICRRIDDAVETPAEFIESLRAVEVHLEDAILRAVAEILKDFSHLCPTSIITDIVSYHVEHIHTSEPDYHVMCNGV